MNAAHSAVHVSSCDELLRNLFTPPKVMHLLCFFSKTLLLFHTFTPTLHFALIMSAQVLRTTSLKIQKLCNSPQCSEYISCISPYILIVCHSNALLQCLHHPSLYLQLFCMLCCRALVLKSDFICAPQC